MFMTPTREKDGQSTLLNLGDEVALREHQARLRQAAEVNLCRWREYSPFATSARLSINIALPWHMSVSEITALKCDFILGNYSKSFKHLNLDKAVADQRLVYRFWMSNAVFKGLCP